MEINLIEPDIIFEQQYMEYHSDLINSGEKFVPYILKFYDGNIIEYVEKLKGFSIGKGIDDFVNNSTYWLVLNNSLIIGTLNIRHFLNKQLLMEGGHIGYGIRPSFRNKGYGTIILQEGLKKAKILRIKKALLTCDKSNIGSSKIIIKNGGVLESEILYNCEMISRYWINLE